MHPLRQCLEHRFFVAGVNYRTAPVAVRERMAVAHPDRIEVSRLLQRKAGLAEIIVLWTCNRVEIYGVAAGDTVPDPAPLFECLAREMPGLADHVYQLQGREALVHLLRVASGLESMVLGETQITGQVRDAYEISRQNRLAGKILHSVFQKALQTAKAVRTKTTIGQGARSVGGVAVALAKEALGPEGLRQHRILLIGAGEMAACCLRHLQKKGECEVLVANRSLDRAERLAQEFGGRALPFGGLFEAMAEVDVVISSTGSAHTIMGPAEIAPVMAARGGRPLVLIDIAVPRDIDPGVARLENVHLHDIDALEAIVQQTMGRWERDLALCETIIGGEVENLLGHFESRGAALSAIAV